MQCNAEITNTTKMQTLKEKLALRKQEAPEAITSDFYADGITSHYDADANEVVIVSADGERPVAKAPKRRIAAAILDEVEKLLPGDRL